MSDANQTTDGVLYFQHWKDIGQLVAVQHCKRCAGRGWHHGFGERGESPDWCLDCGGAQYDFVDLLTPLET